MEIRFAIAAGLIVAVLATETRAQAVDVTPQWQRTLEFEVRATDTTSHGGAPSRTMLPDGDLVLATRADDTTLLLRRVAPDGTVVRSARASVPTLSSSNTVLVVRNDAASGDILVMAGSGQFCGLQRFDSSLARRWSMTLPADPQMATCMDLAVLDDGSAIALQFGALSRITAQGAVAWDVLNGDDARYFAGHAMALGTDGTIWIAGQGDLIAQGANHVAVQRFTPTGLRLPADVVACTGCVSTIPMDVSLGSNGEVFVVGVGGAPQRGFFVRYAGDGTRLVLAESESDRYLKVVVDDAGNVYGQSTIQVHRIDPANGSALWGRAASDSVAVDDGVVATRILAGTFTLVAVRLDGNGAETWQTTLSKSVSPISSPTTGMREGSLASWLIHDSQGTTGNCNYRPRLVRVSAANGSATDAWFCSALAGQRAVALDARDGVGSLVATEHHLTAFASDGSPRWQVETCALCASQSVGYTRWSGAVLRTDGGAWAIEAMRETSAILSPWQLSVRGIAADGTIGAPFVLGSESLSPEGLIIRRTADDGLVVLRSIVDQQFSTVFYHRFDAAGEQIASWTFPMPDSSTMLRSMRLLVDGGLVFVSEGVLFCMVGCNSIHVGITRIHANGSLAWHYGFGEAVEPAEVALEPDGSASALLPLAPSGVIHRRMINAEGIAGADVPVPGIEIWARVRELSALLSGRQVAVFDGLSSYGIALLDTQGHVTATRELNPQTLPFITTGAHGFLTTDYLVPDADAELLSATNLQTTARFRFPGSTLATASPTTYGMWSTLDDGKVYGTTTVTDANGARQLAHARFNVPGSGADRIFAHGFD